MDFTQDEDELKPYREQASRWIEHNLPALASEAERQRVSGDSFSPEIHRCLAAAGWLGAGWPTEYGGTDNEVGVARAIHQQIALSGVRMIAWLTTSFVINTIRDRGTEAQKRSIISDALRGAMIIALGYTEPEAGSDAAAARTRAVRHGDEWVINGQKMFTSCAHLATHVFMLTRTDPELPKHNGLTTFLVPLDAEGVEIQPVWTLSGERTNATFYADVRTPDEFRIGDINGGWDVLRTALMYERGGQRDNLRPENLETTRSAVEWAQRNHRDDGSRVWDDPVVRERLVRHAINEEITELLRYRAVWAAQQGDLSGAPTAAVKVFGSETTQQREWDLLDMFGAAGVLKREAGDAPLDAAIEEAARDGVVGPIAGGSNEVLRGIIAERQLGLPRCRPPR